MEHFKNAERGFSINSDAPLDMRFSTTNPLTAQTIINTYSASQLEQMLTTYGDFSPKTANYLVQGIIEARKKSLYITTGQLITTLRLLHLPQKKIAVFFQALRIETNAELDQLKIFLQTFSKQITIGGRCAIITYHSIEDRMVKIAFKTLTDTGDFRLVNKKVIQPHYTEVATNKAARSAKLRIIEKTQEITP
jgi:16S rRNA (cytosine1402-N4)-methyltransferase